MLNVCHLSRHFLQLKEKHEEKAVCWILVGLVGAWLKRLAGLNAFRRREWGEIHSISEKDYSWCTNLRDFRRPRESVAWPKLVFVPQMIAGTEASELRQNTVSEEEWSRDLVSSHIAFSSGTGWRKHSAHLLNDMTPFAQSIIQQVS